MPIRPPSTEGAAIQIEVRRGALTVILQMPGLATDCFRANSGLLPVKSLQTRAQAPLPRPTNEAHTYS